MKHTPRPWNVYAKTLVIANHKLIANAADILISGGDYMEEAEANACLIAAAPELLEACEKLVKNMNSVWQSEYRGTKDPENDPDLEPFRALIAKAKGEI